MPLACAARVCVDATAMKTIAHHITQAAAPTREAAHHIAVGVLAFSSPAVFAAAARTQLWRVRSFLTPDVSNQPAREGVVALARQGGGGFFFGVVMAAVSAVAAWFSIPVT